MLALAEAFERESRYYEGIGDWIMAHSLLWAAFDERQKIRRSDMAFVAKDGSKHTNHSSMKQADARHAAKSPAAEAINAEEPNGEPDAANEQDGKAMAQQHGPAVEVSIQHDHKGGQHHVHAVHPDMHEHDSVHGSAAEAHQFAGDCAGGGMQ